MEPRFSADIAGQEPRRVPPEHRSPLYPLHEWIHLACMGRPRPVTAPAITGKPTPHDARALRLVTSQDVLACSAPAGPDIQSSWSGIYAGIRDYAGSLCGDMDRGGFPRPGQSWVQSLFPAARTTNPSADIARLTLLAEALADDTQTPAGIKAWKDACLLAPAMSPWSKDWGSHWNLVVLDTWKRHAMAHEPGPASLALDLLANIVSNIDRVVAFPDNEQPLYWRTAARHANMVVTSLLGHHGADLSPIDAPPINAPTPGWRLSNSTSKNAGWRTGACELIHVLSSAEGSHLWNEWSPTRRNEAMSAVAQSIRDLNTFEKSFASGSCERMASSMESRFGPAEGARIRHYLLDALTDLSPSRSARAAAPRL
jgi:hypothetical protein